MRNSILISLLAICLLPQVALANTDYYYYPAASASATATSSGSGVDSSASATGDASASASASNGETTSSSTAGPQPSSAPSATSTQPAGTKTPVTTITPTTNVSTTVPDRVGTPVVTKLTINSVAIPPYSIAIQQVANSQLIHLEGTATPQGMVIVTIANNAATVVSHEIQADATGKWEKDIEVTDLAADRYRVAISGKDASGTLTPPQNVVSFDVTSSNTTPPVTTETPSPTTQRTVTAIAIGIGVLILIGIIIAVVRYLQSRRTQPPLI